VIQLNYQHKFIQQNLEQDFTIILMHSLSTYLLELQVDINILILIK